ncbi:MAG: cytochrome c biogenesis protein CcsA [Verrucomicrobiales bacterium]|nr:cytochrome c biogenesis protein CcsA [Verrucomicrobiales bacterium]
MTTTAWILCLAAAAFLAAVVRAVLILRAGRWRDGRSQRVLMGVGLGLLTGFLYLRGHEVGQCPMKSLPDVLVFVAWSMVLLYFMVGTTYRLSLLGLFTAPLVLILVALGGLLPGAFEPYSERGPIVPLVELHAAVALVAYAAFAMACVTGVMYLVQERLLKQHRIGGLFFQLPPIRELARAIGRLVWLGWLLLTAALGMSMALEQSVAESKLLFAWAVWGLYGVIALLYWRHGLSPRLTAWLAVAGFVMPFVSLWIINHV